MKNILIVDDNPQDLYLLQTLLSRHGYGVTAAANGAEALEKARSERPDMIISDILMPKMDGFELCREWKRDGRLTDIPFVFFTATYNDPKDEKFALGLGAERFVVKPQETNLFLGMIEEVFSEHKAGRVTRPCEPQHDEVVYFKEYNEALIRKLEDKMVQVEEARRRLEREVAEHMRTEKALRGLERQSAEIAEYNQLVIGSSSLGIATYDAESGMGVSANDAFAKIIGATVEEAAGQNFRRIESWEKSGLLKTAEDVLSDGGERQHDIHVVTTFGKETWLGCRLARFTIKDKAYLLLMIADITERKRAEEALEESERKYRFLVANAHEAIFIAQDNVVKFPNPKVLEMTGYSTEGMAGVPFTDLIHPEDRGTVQERYIDRLRGGTPREPYPFRIMKKTGEEIWAQLNAERIDWEGRPGVLCFLRDITKER
ncbi:MAG: response regulator, partial [Desulfobacteria bacterium]|nr:PAS domain S-box protein [Deltaproteobacteria bacterium]